MSLLLTLNIFHTCVSNVNFEQVNTSWVFFISLPFEFYYSPKFPKMRYHFCNSSGNAYFEITYSVFKKFRKTLKTNKKPFLVFNASSHWVFPTSFRPLQKCFPRIFLSCFEQFSNSITEYLRVIFILKVCNCFGSKNVFEKSASFMLYIQVICVRTIPAGFTCSKLTIETLE